MSKKSIINKKSLVFLEKYINNPSPTGFEAEGQKIWLEYIKPYVDDYIVDTYGSVVGVINPEKKYSVVIEAHADEISWFVHYITDDGFLYLRRNGGSDHQIAPSKRVNIHTPNGIVKAVFGWPAIHTRRGGKEEVPKLENIMLPAITEFLIIDLLGPVLFAKSLLKIDIKNYKHFKMIIISISDDKQCCQML